MKVKIWPALHCGYTCAYKIKDNQQNNIIFVYFYSFFSSYFFLFLTFFTTVAYVIMQFKIGYLHIALLLAVHYLS